MPASMSLIAGKPQLLDQAVLQGAIDALDPAFRLARIGTQDLNVELRQRPAELGHALTTLHVRLRHPEHRMLVGVERNRTAVGLEIATPAPRNS